MNRERFRSNSNNTENPNKNICVEAVAKFLKVDQRVRYLHTIEDLLRAVRKQFTARSRFSKLPKNPSLLDASKKCSEIADELNRQGHQVIGFVVGTPRHVLFLSDQGNVFVDTSDAGVSSKVDVFYAVYR